MISQELQYVTIGLQLLKTLHACMLGVYVFICSTLIYSVYMVCL